MKVSINGARLAELLYHAKRAGTLEKWADLAMEWITAAEKEIDRLEEELAAELGVKR